MSHPAASQPQYVLRLRSVAALLAINIVAGVWLHLNAPEAIPDFSLGSVLVAIPTVLGLLPEEEKTGWRRSVMSRVHDALGRSGTAAALTWTAFVLAVAGSLCTSVRVDTATGATAEIQIVAGTQTDADSGAVGRADTLRLDRDHAVTTALRAVWPARSAWAYTSTHVSQRDRVPLPWHPARWSYPEDFDEIVTLFVLATTSADHALRSHPAPRFVLRGAGGDTVLDTVLPDSGARVQFVDRSLDEQALLPAWTQAYREHLAPARAGSDADSLLLLGLLALADTSRRAAFVQRYDTLAVRLGVVPGRVRRWAHAERLRGRRPLHLGERMRFHFADQRGDIRQFEVVLDRNPYALLIDDSHFSRSPIAPP